MAEPLVLALDTASVVSVGLARGQQLLGEAYVEDRMAHAEQLVPLVRRLFEGAGVTLAEVATIVVGLGPGPFTGLRVGVVTARVLSAVTGARLHGVCSLDVIAAEHAPAPGEDFLVATDARRQEVYWARYAADGTRRAGPAVGRPETLPELPVIGPAALTSPGLAAAGSRAAGLNAGLMARQGTGLPSAGAEPLYLRRPDAVASTRPKRVLLTRPAERSP